MKCPVVGPRTPSVVAAYLTGRTRRDGSPHSGRRTPRVLIASAILRPKLRKPNGSSYEPTTVAVVLAAVGVAPATACSSSLPALRRTPHARIPSPAIAADAVAASPIFAQMLARNHHGRRSLKARPAASSREPTPSFERISETWNFAVLSVMPRRSAIWALLAPERRSASTSHSRGVRISGWRGRPRLAIKPNGAPSPRNYTVLAYSRHIRTGSRAGDPFAVRSGHLRNPSIHQCAPSAFTNVTRELRPRRIIQWVV